MHATPPPASLPHMQCPLVYQPENSCRNDKCVKHGSESKTEDTSFSMDPLVVHTVQLIQYSRKIQRHINSLLNQQDGRPGGPLSPVLPIASTSKIPKYSGPTIDKSKKLFNFTSTEAETPPETCEPTPVDRVTCRALLRRSVATLFAHIGYENCSENLLDLMTDVASSFLSQFLQHLRAAKDHELQFGQSAFPDILEQVFHEVGMGSVTSLHDFYQRRVILYHDNEQKTAERLAKEYELLRHTAAQSVDMQPETFTLIKIKDEPYSNDIQFPNLDETDDVDPDHLLQLEGLSNFEITVEQETVSGLTTEVDSRWTHSVKSETSESKDMIQLERYADPGSTSDAPPSAHSEQGDPLHDPPSMSNSDIMSPPTLTKYNTGPSVRKKKKRH